jgi:hypothetical protein
LDYRNFNIDTRSLTFQSCTMMFPSASQLKPWGAVKRPSKSFSSGTGFDAHPLEIQIKTMMDQAATLTIAHQQQRLLAPGI